MVSGHSDLKNTKVKNMDQINTRDEDETWEELIALNSVTVVRRGDADAKITG